MDPSIILLAGGVISALIITLAGVTSRFRIRPDVETPRELRGVLTSEANKVGEHGPELQGRDRPLYQKGEMIFYEGRPMIISNTNRRGRVWTYDLE